MTRIDGSLAGVVVAETKIAHVDGGRGLALIRGYPLPELAAQCSYEEVAYLVLYGDLPTKSELDSFQHRLTEQGTLPNTIQSAARNLGQIVPHPEALAAASGLLDAERIGTPTEQAERVFARVPALTAAVAGYPAPDPAWPYARKALAALGAKRTDALAQRALEVLLSLEAEHGLSASTFACRIAASSGAKAGVSLGAAVATLTGPRHGGATAEARALLREALASGDTVAFVHQAREQKRKLAGFGHRIYKVPDPRLPPLRSAIEAMGNVQLLPVAITLMTEGERLYGARGVYANIDLFGAVLLDALGVEPEHNVAAFALGLAPGWMAHWLEQGATDRLIRPDSAYTGPSQRAIQR